MKDLNKLASECEQDLLSIGIQPGKVNRWIINTRAKCRWGLCKTVQPGLFDISIAARLLQDDIDDQAAKILFCMSYCTRLKAAKDIKVNGRSLLQR